MCMCGTCVWMALTSMGKKGPRLEMAHARTRTSNQQIAKTRAFPTLVERGGFCALVFRSSSCVLESLHVSLRLSTFISRSVWGGFRVRERALSICSAANWSIIHSSLRLDIYTRLQLEQYRKWFWNYNPHLIMNATF